MTHTETYHARQRNYLHPASLFLNTLSRMSLDQLIELRDNQELLARMVDDSERDMEFLTYATD